MKIAIDCRMLNTSGIGNVLKSILSFLPKEHNYVLLGDEKALKNYKADNINIYNCIMPIFSMKELFSFPVKVVNECDAFFTPNYNIPFFIRVKKFSMIHDVVFLDIKGLTGVMGYIIRYMYLLRAVIISKKIFTVSDFSQSRIIHYFGHSKKIRKITLEIPKPLDYELPKLKKQIDSNSYFIYVGNVKKHKGIDTLIEAFNNFPDKSVRLYIVGKKDSFKTSLEERNLQISENIIFTGYVDDNKLYNLIYNAKALIQPSFYEGFGIPPLEALYLGIPAIISDIPVFKEIYGNLPVTFFQCGNPNDLIKKISDIKPISIDKQEFKKIFDFNKSEEIIFRELENE